MKSLPLPLRALVTDQERRTTKHGELFWQVMLKTRIGPIKAMMWRAPNDVETHPKYPHIQDIIEVDSFDDQLADRQNIVIKTFHRITKEELPPEDASIVEVEKASAEELQSAWEFIQDNSFWENNDHHTFTMNCLAKTDQGKLFNCPAAAKVHHAFQGGLLIHTAEVLELCRVYVEASEKRYSFINKDVVYASAILHDIGKVETYSFNELGLAQQEKTEHIIGHIFYGMHLVQQVADEWNNKANIKDYVEEVLHCIAAHHGTREWGSIVEPASLEAGLVSRVDYLSSRNGMMEKVLKENIQSGQPLADEFRIYSHDYFASTGIKSYISRG